MKRLATVVLVMAALCGRTASAQDGDLDPQIAKLVATVSEAEGHHPDLLGGGTRSRDHRLPW